VLTPYVWICMCSCETGCGRLFSDRSDAATIVATGIHGPCWAWGGAPRAEREGDNPGIAVRRRCCGTVCWRAVGDRVRVTYNER